MAIRPTLVCSCLLPLSLLGALPGAQADTSPERVDALTVFARQRATAAKPTGPDPAVIGAYLWGGRADIDYRPFFQWELRLMGGSAPAEQVRARISTLSPTRTILVSGDWLPWPSIPAGAVVDCRYRTHCPTFSAYQLELTWSGGGETYVACDKGAIPVPLGAVKGQGFAVAVNLNHEPAAGGMEFTWSDWNLGGRPAKQVVHTLHLFDLASHELKHIALPAVAEIPPGSVVPGHALLAHLPAFATAGITVEESSDSSREMPGFTNVADLEVAELHQVGDHLEGRVRNGLTRPVQEAVVTLTLTDAAGAHLGSTDIAVGTLAPGQIRPLRATITGASGWVGYETAWREAAAATPAPAPDHAAAASHPAEVPPAVSAGPLRFTPSALTRTPAGWLLAGRLRNTSPTAVGAVRVTLALQGADGSHEEVQCVLDALDAGADQAVSFATSLPHIQALSLRWAATGSAPPPG